MLLMNKARETIENQRSLSKQQLPQWKSQSISLQKGSSDQSSKSLYELMTGENSKSLPSVTLFDVQTYLLALGVILSGSGVAELENHDIVCERQLAKLSDILTQLQATPEGDREPLVATLNEKLNDYTAYQDISLQSESSILKFICKQSSLEGISDDIHGRIAKLLSPTQLDVLQRRMVYVSSRLPQSSSTSNEHTVDLTSEFNQDSAGIGQSDIDKGATLITDKGDESKTSSLKRKSSDQLDSLEMEDSKKVKLSDSDRTGSESDETKTHIKASSSGNSKNSEKGEKSMDVSKHTENLDNNSTGVSEATSCSKSLGNGGGKKLSDCDVSSDNSLATKNSGKDQESSKNLRSEANSKANASQEKSSDSEATSGQSKEELPMEVVRVDLNLEDSAAGMPGMNI